MARSTLPESTPPTVSDPPGRDRLDGQRLAPPLGPAELDALENVRRLLDRNRRQGQCASATAEVEQVGIVGAGQMGAAIAAVHAKRYLGVVLVDPREEALAEARQVVLAELARDGAGRQAERLANRLLFAAATDQRLCECDLVLESIVEDAAAKQALYARLEPRLAAGAIWGSNTSAIPIARLAARLADPARFCGLHFFHPVGIRPLVEIVRGPRTSEATLAKAAAHVRRLGKMPIVVEDGPGFAMNRILMAYLSAALALLAEGVEIEQIEQAMVDFGMAMSPLEMLDEIGLDTALRTGLMLAGSVGQRQPGIEILVRLVKRGELGCKRGSGFFVYPQRAVNPAVRGLVAQGSPAPSARLRPQQITGRLLAPMLAEAVRVLEEGKVRDPRDIDLGVIFGLGFPAFRGGLLWWADHWEEHQRREFLDDAQRAGSSGGADLAAAHGHVRYYGREEFPRQSASQVGGIAIS